MSVVPLNQRVKPNRALTFEETKIAARELALDIRKIDRELSALQQLKRQKLREYHRLMNIGIHLMIAAGAAAMTFLSLPCSVSLALHGLDNSEQRAALSLSECFCLTGNAPDAGIVLWVPPEQLSWVNI